jgi:hypothetical protein
MRISNFLLWQLAYSEIYVTETLWPDFRRARTCSKPSSTTSSATGASADSVSSQRQNNY